MPIRVTVPVGAAIRLPVDGSKSGHGFKRTEHGQIVFHDHPCSAKARAKHPKSYTKGIFTTSARTGFSRMTTAISVPGFANSGFT